MKTVNITKDIAFDVFLIIKAHDSKLITLKRGDINVLMKLSTSTVCSPYDIKWIKDVKMMIALRIFNVYNNNIYGFSYN